MYSHDIGIVIVNYNVRHFLVRCLQSIRNSHTGGLKTDVWVVDNASVDGSVGLVSNEFPEVRLIANDRNLGFSAANNQAIRQVNAEYILLLNPDTVLQEDTLKKCHDFMMSHPEAGAVGVRMIDGTGRFLPESKRQVPGIWNSFCKLTFLSGMFPGSRLFSGYNLGYLPEFDINEVEVLCGAFMFIRASALEKTGLLDEAFFMYGEDIDLSYRLLQAGYKIYYFPETSIIHYKGESTKKGSLNYVRTFYGAMDIYVNKHYGQGNARLFALVIKTAIWLRAVMSGLYRLVAGALHPLVDFGLTWVLMTAVKGWWAGYHFGDQSYYDGTAIHIMLGIYSSVWVFFLWLTGQYDAKGKLWGAIGGVITGTFSLLVVYALLPETMRTSRMMILLGSMAALFVALLTSYISNLLSRSKKHRLGESAIAIVAGKEIALTLAEIIRKAGSAAREVHFITPEPKSDPFFSGSLEALPSMVKSLNIGEVIYSSQDLPMKEIIKSMTSMQKTVTFRIGGDESLSVIGSHSKNLPAELYSLDITYRIAEPIQLRLKRMLDIVVAVLALPLLPILFIAGGLKPGVLVNVFSVLIGRKTWVGYGGETSDFGFLPPLKPGVIPYPMTGKRIDYIADHFKNENIRYAREYTLTDDVRLILSNLNQLANK